MALKLLLSPYHQEKLRMADSYEKPRPLTPDIYSAQIVACDTMPFHWRKSPSNPDGMTVRFVVSLMADDGPATVTDAVDASNLQRLASVYRSTGSDEPPFDYLMSDIHNLRGQSCTISTKNITPRMGKHAGVEKAVISRWLEPQEAVR